MNNNHYEFPLIPLPYPYDALEPYIDTLTMELHHNRHLKTYVDNLNKALKDYPQYQSYDLERLIKSANWFPETLREQVKKNAGGVYNHEFFFANLAPHNNQGTLSEDLLNKINETFLNYENFKKEFKQKALDVFGSGYAWLVSNKDGDIKIIMTANQDTPLTLNLIPIMCIDVWEHAYYLKHYNLRKDYIDDWFNVANLSMASKNYKNIKNQ